MNRLSVIIFILFLCFWAGSSAAWHDETHISLARAAGYAKWYNAVGADMAKLKAGAIERNNHYSNNPTGTILTPEMMLQQVQRYNKVDPKGHLYGAILASVREYMKAKDKGKYGEYHLAYAVHYLGDLSMPLHHLEYDAFNRARHAEIEAAVDEKILDGSMQIHLYPVTVRSEADLVREMVRVGNLSMRLGERIRAEDRLLTTQEAYEQLGHSASLLRAVLEYTGAPRLDQAAWGETSVSLAHF